MESTGRIAERRHPAICALAKGIAAERYWMPKRSDCSCSLHGIIRKYTVPTLLNMTKVLLSKRLFGSNQECET